MATAADLVRWPGRPRGAVLVAAAGIVGAEALIGAAVASGRRELALAAVGGAAASWALVRAPFAGACAFLALVASVLAGPPIGISLAGYRLHAHELLLAGLLALAWLRPRRRTWGGAAGLALALFLGVLALSAALAVQSGAGPLSEVIQWSRGYVLLAFFWVVVRLFPEREQLLRLLRAAAVIGGVTGFYAFALALGLSPEPLFTNPGEAVIAPQGALQRVRLPGLALSFAMLWLVLLAVVRGARPRLLWGLCLLGCALDLLVSFNRNMWVAAAVGVALLLLLTGPQVRGRVVASFAVVLAAVALLVVVPQTSGPVTAAIEPLVERGETLLRPSRVRRESSLQDRMIENRIAWATAREHLLLGVGPGVGWGLYQLDRSLPVPRRTPQLFIHNQYLYLLVIAGIPGLVCFVLFLLRSAAAAFGGVRRQPELAVLGIAIVGFMLTSIVMLSFSDPSYLAAIALVTAAAIALRAAAPAPEGGR